MPKKTDTKKKYIPNSKEKYMCAKHKKFFTDELLKWKSDINKANSILIPPVNGVALLWNFLLLFGKSISKLYFCAKFNSREFIAMDAIMLIIM